MENMNTIKNILSELPGEDPDPVVDEWLKAVKEDQREINENEMKHVQNFEAEMLEMWYHNSDLLDDNISSSNTRSQMTDAEYNELLSFVQHEDMGKLEDIDDDDISEEIGEYPFIE